MINTKTNQLIASVTSLVQDSGLPPVNARLALDVVRLQLLALEREAMQQEQAEAAKDKQGGA